jgi:hypothetical protein
LSSEFNFLFFLFLLLKLLLVLLHRLPQPIQLHGHLRTDLRLLGVLAIQFLIQSDQLLLPLLHILLQLINSQVELTDQPVIRFCLLIQLRGYQLGLMQTLLVLMQLLL